MIGTNQATGLIGCTYRKLYWWLSHDVLGPYAEPGYGTPMFLTETQIELAWVVARLVELGAQVPVVRLVASSLTAGPPPTTGDVLVVFSDGSVLRRRYSDLTPTSACWVVPHKPFAEILDDASGWIIVRTGEGGEVVSMSQAAAPL